ncbi:MAG TPA: hypothetical protein VML75_17685 [Kofleriaceae bacterium]|nr:hypothetical protein [Kofleriaceae bacterium]
MALLVGCSGPPSTGGTGGGTGAGAGRGSTGGDPEVRLRALVEAVVTLAEQAECASFGATLTGWTNTHSAEVEKLIAALATSKDADTLAELDGYVETRRLVVLEAAADCGEFEDAWPAWQHFEAMVEQARE